MNTTKRHVWHGEGAPAPRHLGIDIGRVIIHGDGPDTSFVGAGSDEEALRAPAIDGAFASIARLVRRFSGQVWLVSKCGKRVEARSRLWLDHHGFYKATGVAKENLRFCRDRRDKAPICVELGIGFFIDDRIDVLVSMENLVPHRFLFGSSASPDPGVVPAPTWAATEAAIERVLSEREATGGRERPAAPLL
jgi:hypothetical protein